jgi:hypothetical protein
LISDWIGRCTSFAIPFNAICFLRSSASLSFPNFHRAHKGLAFESARGLFRMNIQTISCLSQAVFRQCEIQGDCRVRFRLGMFTRLIKMQVVSVPRWNLASLGRLAPRTPPHVGSNEVNPDSAGPKTILQNRNSELRTERTRSNQRSKKLKITICVWGKSGAFPVQSGSNMILLISRPAILPFPPDKARQEVFVTMRRLLGRS